MKLTIQNMHVNSLTALSYFIYCSILILLLSFINTQPFADDKFFMEVVNNHQIIPWMIDRYNAWSGRIAIDFLTVITINHKLLWGAIFVISLHLLVTSITRICCESDWIVYKIITILLVLVMERGISAESIFWVSGFFNYLLPVSFGLYGLSNLLTMEKGYIKKVISVLSVTLASYQEQMAIILLFALILMLIFDKKYRVLINCICFASVLINFMISINAPGNLIRKSIETWRYFPQHADFGFPEMFMLGFDRVYQFFFYGNNVLLLFFLLVLCVLCFKCLLNDRDRTIINMASMLLIVSFFILLISKNLIIPHSGGENIIRIYEGGLDLIWVSSTKLYFFYAYFLFVFCAILNVLHIISQSSKQFGYHSLALVFGCISVGLLGLSPTVYESSFRVGFILQLSLVFVSIGMLHSYAKDKVY